MGGWGWTPVGVELARPPATHQPAAHPPPTRRPPPTHPPPAHRPAWLAGWLAGWPAGWPAENLDFLCCFQNGLKRAPRALGGPGGPIFPYFCPVLGPLGGAWGALGPPYLPLFALKGCCAVGKHLRCSLHWSSTPRALNKKACHVAQAPSIFLKNQCTCQKGCVFLK